MGKLVKSETPKTKKALSSASQGIRRAGLEVKHL